MFKTKREIPTALDILILKIWNLGPYIFNKEPWGFKINKNPYTKWWDRHS